MPIGYLATIIWRLVMFEVFFETVSRSGDDWRVVGGKCGNGYIYWVERNQGEHDRRFFQVGKAYLDPLEATSKCEKLAKGWPYTRFVNK